ncbi:MAG: glycine--tRNA ligase subunit beta [Xanthomonadales bacterium]|nr:glycine--tRNA ligase subunit beta [Xanthomonadales bacterium]
MTDSDRQDLLVELGCEELPPGTLQQLAEAFCNGVRSQLEAAGIEYHADDSRVFYTPRRLAFRLAGVAGRQPDQVQERKGPSVAAAFDADGQPTQAALGFARSVDRPVEALDRQKTDKGEWLFCRVENPGKPLGELLFPMLEKALAALPVAKPMRWAAHDYSFVRPVHWLLVLHGDTVVPGRLFGLEAGRETHGHRVHAPGPHAVDRATEYEQVLENARVLVDPELRRERIREAAVKAAREAGAQARITPALLTEVSHIVEWPVAIPCAFDTGFLEVPPEALIASMEDHQKFFPAEDPDSGALTANFVAIANIESNDPGAVRDGLERVIRPRLADARFFWEQDLQQPLEAYAPRLDDVLFQKELGSVSDKSRRLEIIVEQIAELAGIKPDAAARAATLCKCDLLTQMVNEFPELQGTMGGHYARASGEPDAVARAIAEHYAPRFAGDNIPGTEAGRLLALADRLDTLVGIFAIGRKPTGSKDPFALRRAALGAVRIMLEAPLAVPLDPLFGAAAKALQSQVTVPAEHLEEARAFLLARARQHCIDQGHPTRLVNAVFAAPVSTLPDLAARLEALNAFMQLAEAEALVAANKRIGNILQSAEQDAGDIDEDRLDLPEEKALFEEVKRLEATVLPHFDRGEYGVALEALAALDRVIAPFFDAVMVMDDDPVLRHNRLSLLTRLKRLFDRVADLSQAA